MVLRRESVLRTGMGITRRTFRRKVELQNMDTLRVRRQEDALNNKKIKGSPIGKKGRHIIIPEQMGHEVQTCGDY
eukprot:4082111-Heterocapsa_arctica.AAC.1